MVIAIVVAAFLFIRREARMTGGEREARETLERAIEMDEKGHKLDGRPVPVGRSQQLKRLRALLKALPRSRD